MMVGSLTFHQIQIQSLTPPPNTATPPASEQQKRARDQCPPSLNQIQSIQEFKQAHARFIKLGLDRAPRYAGQLLSACALSDWASLDYARSIFSGLDEPGTFDFNTMIRAHVNFSDPNAALRLYRQMMASGVRPDNFTFPFVVKACAQLSCMRQGTQAHGHVVKFGHDDDVFVQNGLINLYGKCQDIDSACRVFDKMGSNRTVASWSSILAAHNRMGLWSECLDLFAAMIGLGARPDESSLVSVLASCAHLGVLDAGRGIHCSLTRSFAGLNAIVRTSLIDMYVRCGSLDKGLMIFNQMPEKNKWAYSAVISGLAMHGDGEKALKILDDMVGDGTEVDDAVYVGVLSACSHAGLIEEGLRCFDRMRLEHRIAPTAQHYGCVVDVMARAGRLDEAYALVGSMPVELRTDSAWRSLLSACKVHGQLGLAERAARKLAELGRAKAGDYVILSNMYAKAGMWEDAARARTEMMGRGLRQVPGFSRVEVKGKMHTFVSMDEAHQRRDEIYEMLHQMEWQLKFEGYAPDTSHVLLHNGDEEEKLRALSGHSQKLAIAFGLLNTRRGDAIRIVTNLRMSSECHAYSGLISKIFEREILVRDRNRFHCFRRGACSCRDFW